MSEISREEREQLHDSIKNNSEIRAKQFLNWVWHLDRVNELLLDSQYDSIHRDLENLYWIRLYGVLVEIEESFEATLEILKVQSLEEFKGKYPFLFETKGAMTYMYDIFKEINNIRAILDKDELIAIDNYRQTNCHILQNGYELSIKKKKGKEKLKENYFVKTLGKTMSVDKLKASLLRTAVKCNGNTVLISQDIANKLKGNVKKLLAVYTEFNT